MTPNLVCKSCCPMGRKYLFRLVTEIREEPCPKCKGPGPVVDLLDDDLYSEEDNESDEELTIYRR